MSNLKTIAAGAAIAGSLGFAALGLGAGVASAAPPTVGFGTEFAQGPGWGHGPGGPDWDNGPRGPGGWNNGPGWGPPPPPNYGYGGWNGGYGGYDNGYGNGGCVTGPFGLLHFCN